ncbi:MAG: aminopeptidase [Lentisphaeria bacterium]|nr:aminopeptidase [Lentisphaeria bacterium]
MDCSSYRSNPLAEQVFIDQLVASLHATYADGDAINQTDGNNLPRESEILDILRDLLELVYPGFQEKAHYSASNLRYSVGEILSRSYSGLRDLIFRSLQYSCKLAEGDTCACGCGQTADEAARYLLSRLPEIRNTLKKDVAAAYDGDPAAKSNAEIVLSYPGLKAITIQRIAHCLYEKNVPLIPRMMGEYAHRITGIDIHPGATLGESVFIDHGTGVVIGETACIGSNVKIYQGVTIGALSFPKDESGKIIKGKKRHPTIEDDVTIYAGATILGPITVGHSSVIGGNAWITEDVEPFSKITISPPLQTVRKSGKGKAFPVVQETRKEKMIHAALAVLKDSLAVKKGEKVLLLYDKGTLGVGEAFRQAGVLAGISVTGKEIQITPAGGADPDEETCLEMGKYPVIVAATTNSLTHCRAMTQARRNGTRAVTLPGITEDLFARSVPEDPLQMRRTGEKLLKKFAGKHKCRLTTEKGTLLTFETGKYPFESDDGFFSKKGVVGNIPAGEVFGIPEKMNGSLVVDGSIAGTPWKKGMPAAEIRIRNNSAVSFHGARGKALEKALAAAGAKATKVAEFGIGLNPSLALSGNVLEDEKVKGTVHIAFGNDAGMGGTNDVPVHIDCIIQAPTLELDGKIVMEKGVWKLGKEAEK